MLDFLKQDQDPLTGKVMRKVRSFVLREGRLTAGQQRALDTLWPRFGLERSSGELDAFALFGRDAPRLLELAMAWASRWYRWLPLSQTKTLLVLKCIALEWG